MDAFRTILAALDGSGTRYVVVGGVAVVLHGASRLTADLDVVIDLEPEPARQALAALEKIGLQPRLPVPTEDFADPEKRSRWIAEKGMKVFSLVDFSNPLRSVDLFVEPPLDFEELWEHAVTVDVDGIPVRIASLEDLIAIKREAGRPKDLEDADRLETLRRARERDP
jgi:hypothetical protein